MGPNTHTSDWTLPDDVDTAMGPATTHDIENGGPDIQLDDAGHPGEMMSKAYEEKESTRDRPVKPNKIYIGGLPDHTRPEDLRNCFGKLGNIVAIELKLGYGFVEFDNKESAEESVARYHEGYFMGNKIRVEPSHSRGRSFKRLEDPGACYSCGESGHWARECPRSNGKPRGHDQSSDDRKHTRDYADQPREARSHRDEYSKHSNTRDDRYYESSSAPPPSTRDQRPALTPTRDRRENPPPRREYEDYRMRSPPPPQPASRQDRGGHHDSDRDYSGGAANTHRDSYDRYDRRHAHSDDRSAQYSGHSRRPRTPPGPPPSGREDFDYDKPSRGHHQTHETFKRPQTPPPPYPGNNANGSRSRRRSVSPPRYDSSRYGGSSRTEGGDRYSNTTRVRDYHRGGRGEDSGHRRS